MNTPWDHEALWIKAKLFLNHSMDDEPRTFEERALWASHALELLAKAALARTSPALIASPTEDGVNLLIAAGLVSGDAKFQSVPAKTLFTRCGKAFKPFNTREALLIADNRNEYLHGAGVGFDSIPEHTWWARFWAQAHILVEHLDQDLDALVGNDRVKTVEDYLELNARNIENRAETLLERARQRLLLRQSSSPPAWVVRDQSRALDLTAGLRYSTTTTCPICGDDGMLEGEDYESSETHYDQISWDDYDAWVELMVSADYFSCSNCQLVLDRYELLEAVGIEVSFVYVDDDATPYESDYGND